VRRLQELSYAVRDELDTWPTKQTLMDFTQRSCRPMVKYIISDYFDLLQPSFNELKKRVDHVVSSTRKELSLLTQAIGKYERSLEPGPSFIRHVIMATLRATVLTVQSGVITTRAGSRYTCNCWPVRVRVK